MDDDRLRAMEVRSLANEKLLKALISLLAVREPELLDELGAIFALASAEENEMGEAPPKVWAEVRRRMDVVYDLVLAADPELEGETTH